MIIKGGSRAGPRWLGRHLTRRDTNERVEVLELQSPQADLTEAFRDWQALAAGTRGWRGLYHANIDPAIGYAMTADQWWRAVEVLERELKLEGQFRAVVLHEKHGREHLHVVWCRTDIDTMRLRDDGNNFLAHERASLALEREFGHEHVPGKHAKRDRARQQEMPEAALNLAEWQQAERTGLDPRKVRAEIDQLFRQCDSGQAFHAALLDVDFVLAKGDSRDFIVLDPGGGIHPLGRAVEGLRAVDQRAFMQDVSREDLPSVKEARAEQRARAQDTRGKQFGPDPPPDTTALREAWEAQHRQDVQKLEASHEIERARTAETLNTEIAERLGQTDAMHRAALARHDREAEAQRLPQPIERMARFLNPAWAQEQERLRAESRAKVEAGLAEVRQTLLARLETARDAELADLADHQAQRLREGEARFQEDLPRRLRMEEHIQRELARREETRRRAQPDNVDLARGHDPPDRAG